MVAVTIYLKMAFDPKEMVQYLLTEKLIASATIDLNNISYKIVEGEIVEDQYNVITAKSKMAQFDSIVDAVQKIVGETVAISSMPIVGANGFFSDTVRSKRKLFQFRLKKPR